jgi:hypothetical protein
MSFSSSQIPFAPLGNTVTITANVAAPVGVQAPVTAPEYNAGQYRVVNASANTIFLGIGSTAAIAQTRAGSAATSIPLLAGAVEIIRLGQDVFMSGTASAASTLYVTPGQGL